MYLFLFRSPCSRTDHLNVKDNSVLYRIITLVGGLVFVVALFALLWFFCKKFL